jgi:hypothetical protein
MHHTPPRNAFSVGGPIESYEEFLAIALAVFGVNGCHGRVGKRGRLAEVVFVKNRGQLAIHGGMGPREARFDGSEGDVKRL